MPAGPAPEPMTARVGVAGVAGAVVAVPLVAVTYRVGASLLAGSGDGADDGDPAGVEQPPADL